MISAYEARPMRYLPFLGPLPVRCEVFIIGHLQCLVQTGSYYRVIINCGDRMPILEGWDEVLRLTQPSILTARERVDQPFDDESRSGRPAPR
jgi:hypothetical protein